MSISAHLQGFFSNYPSLAKIYIAFSGGLDSTVLLHAMNAIPIPVHAVYVHHHLQKENDDWQQHCEKICLQWDISFSVLHAQIHLQAQQSIEELARNARYELLQSLVSAEDALLTAHHQDDLAETLLLQLLRGAGPQGLAAMPEKKSLTMGLHLRPLLSFTRNQLLDYAQKNKLKWIEDPSNADHRFDRNYLRHELMPKLLQRWPAAQQTMARSAQLQAEASSCLEDLAKIDIQSARTAQADILNTIALQKLNPERLRNVLRYWIRTHDIRVPSKKILQQVIQDMVIKEEMDMSPVQTWKQGEIRRYQNNLYLMRPLKPHDSDQSLCWKIDQPLCIDSLNRTLQPTELNGITLPSDTEELTVRFRQGGERLKPFGQKHHRSLKKLLNEAEVPTWERDRIPLLYHREQLVSVLGYWNTAQDCETPP